MTFTPTSLLLIILPDIFDKPPSILIPKTLKENVLLNINDLPLL